MSDQVGNPKDRFSHNEAQIMVVFLNQHLCLLLMMPPTLKKLMGHIAFGACVGGCVRAWVGAWVTLFVPSVTFKP